MFKTINFYCTGMFLCLSNFAADQTSQTYMAFLFAGFSLDLARTTDMKKISQGKIVIKRPIKM